MDTMMTKAAVVAILIAALAGMAWMAIADEALVEVGSGKVVVVKPDGSPWGRMETNGVFYCVKRIRDDDLRYCNTNDPNCHITFPYAVYSNEVETVMDGTNVVYCRTNRVCVNESLYTIQPDADDTEPIPKDGKDFQTNLVIKPVEGPVVPRLGSSSVRATASGRRHPRGRPR